MVAALSCKSTEFDSRSETRAWTRASGQLDSADVDARIRCSVSVAGARSPDPSLLKSLKASEDFPEVSEKVGLAHP